MSAILDYSSGGLPSRSNDCKVNVPCYLQIALVTSQAITAVIFLGHRIALSVFFMPKFAAVLCQDQKSLQVLGTALNQLDTELKHCRSRQEALEMVMSGQCSTMIVDFDLAGAEEAIRMASLLPPSQKPALLAIATRAWPGTGQAFQSGASRILYRPLTGEVIREALKTGRKADKNNRRKSERYEVKTLVYLQVEHGTISGISIDIAEQGLAKRGNHKHAVRDLLPPADAQVSFAATGEEELLPDVQ
jgi:CheY-like chemotaxis protein